MLWLALALALAAMLAFVPWTLALTFHRDGAARMTARVSWGGLRLTDTGHASSGQAGTDGGDHGEGTSEPARRRRRTRSAARPRARRVLALVRSDDFVGSLTRLVRRLLRHLRPRDTTLSIRFGLGDPASTGRLFGALSPLIAVLAVLDGNRVVLVPDFTRQRFQLEGQTRVRLVPGVVVLLLLGYVFSVPPWRALVRFARA